MERNAVLFDRIAGNRHRFTKENGRLMAKATGLSNAAESENRAKLVKKC
jgi:hypothetical protein